MKSSMLTWLDLLRLLLSGRHRNTIHSTFRRICWKSNVYIYIYVYIVISLEDGFSSSRHSSFRLHFYSRTTSQNYQLALSCIRSLFILIQDTSSYLSYPFPSRMAGVSSIGYRLALLGFAVVLSDESQGFVFVFDSSLVPSGYEIVDLINYP